MAVLTANTAHFKTTSRDPRVLFGEISSASHSKILRAPHEQPSPYETVWTEAQVAYLPIHFYDRFNSALRIVLRVQEAAGWLVREELEVRHIDVDQSFHVLERLH